MSSAQGKLPELMRVYIQHPALEREDVCHQVGFLLGGAAMWSPQRRGCMPSRATSVSSVCRFPFWSARDSRCVIVGAFSSIGVVAHATMIANVSKRSAYMLASK